MHQLPLPVFRKENWLMLHSAFRYQLHADVTIVCEENIYKLIVLC
jgi:hypothetical protein